MKDLYRHAKVLHVGVDITQGVADDTLDLTLYGPGSRALVRSRAAIAGGGGPDEAFGVRRWACGWCPGDGANAERRG